MIHSIQARGMKYWTCQRAATTLLSLMPTRQQIVFGSNTSQDAILNPRINPVKKLIRLLSSGPSSVYRMHLQQLCWRIYVPAVAMGITRRLLQPCVKLRVFEWNGSRQNESVFMTWEGGVELLRVTCPIWIRNPAVFTILWNVSSMIRLRKWPCYWDTCTCTHRITTRLPSDAKDSSAGKPFYICNGR